MTKTHQPLPMKLIRESFRLDPNSPTGLVWLERPLAHFQNERRQRQANAKNAGKPAGTSGWDGKRAVNGIWLAGARLQASRIVFALAYGYDPGSKDVDHIDGDRSNNDPSNLRAITHAQNCMNRNTGRNPASGVTGVYWNQKIQRYLVFIKANGVQRYLGCYADKEDAITARREGEKKYHGEYALSVSR